MAGALMLTIGESRVSKIDTKLSLCEVLSRSENGIEVSCMAGVQKKG